MAKKKLAKNYMDVVFVPHPSRDWREKKNGRIEVDMENKGFFHMIAQKFFHRPRISHIALDQYGSAVWKCLDGTHTVMDIVEAMKEQFPDEQERMLDRVVTFMGILQANHFIQKKEDGAKSPR
ncbi:MAG: PqqD family protein [Lachnospiraceae bacterium]